MRKDLIYTNTRLISDIGEKISTTNINYPKSYKNLTQDTNTNTILTAIQNRAIHLNTAPMGTTEIQQN
jgi:hypothetical protein